MIQSRNWGYADFRFAGLDLSPEKVDESHTY